ncbi:hypothetical protein ACER0C_003371 [Sarotherodon galilaeus]
MQRLDRCGLSEISCDYLAAALKSNPSYPRVLDLSGTYNNLQDSGVKQLCVLLENPRCQFETLSIGACTASSTLSFVVSAWTRLQNISSTITSCACAPSSSFKLTSKKFNRKDDSSITRPAVTSSTAECDRGLMLIRTHEADTTTSSCSVDLEEKCLQLLTGSMQNVDLHKDCGDLIPDSKSTLVCTKLLTRSRHKLKDCDLSEISCDYLAAALNSNPSYPRVLDLSGTYNNLQDSGVKQLCVLLENPRCRFETLSSDFISMFTLA